MGAIEVLQEMVRTGCKFVGISFLGSNTISDIFVEIYQYLGTAAV